MKKRVTNKDKTLTFYESPFERVSIDFHQNETWDVEIDGGIVEMKRKGIRIVCDRKFYKRLFEDVE
jgi:hypothetical protein